MKQKKNLLTLFGGLVLTIALVAAPFSGALALDTMPAPIDPQNWRFARDMTWDDWHDNSAFNWRIDGSKISPNETKHGLLVLYDFVDRPFIVSSPTGAEQMGNPQIGGVPRDELVEFWESFLNDPEDHYNDGLNHGITISEFWQENTQGRWNVELDACGVYRVPGYEFEYAMSGADLPAGFTQRSNVNTLAINLAIADGIDLTQYDFAFVLHAGCAESQIWEEAGYMMFFDQVTIDDFYSAKYRLQQMEANPEITEPIPQAAWDWLDSHDAQKGGDGRGWWASTRYVPWTSWWAHTAIWSSTSSVNVSGIGSFRLSQQGETNGCATFSHEFGHIVSIADNYGTNVNQRVYSGFWDCMAGGSMAGFGGNHTRYEVPNLHGGSVPTHMLSRTKRKLGFIDDNQLTNVNYSELSASTPVVTEIYARTTPIGDQFAAIYPDTLGVIYDRVMAKEASIGLRLYNFTDAKPSTPASIDWETDNWSGSPGRYDNYTLEVVQQVGYDSAQSDSGVLIAKNRESLSESAPYTWQIDAHPGGLDTIDFYTPVGPNGEPSVPQPFRNNDNNHLSASLFHVGKSVTPNDYGVETIRTGQTNEDYKVVVNQDGSVNTKSIADNTVNEYIDTYNSLHFYILDKYYSPGPYGGDILSYQVAVRHFDGKAVGGELEVEVTSVEAESPGRVAVATFDITNTGEATDIIRVTAEGMEAVLLNDLYAIGAGETVTVPVYVEITEDILAKDLASQALCFTASSESNDTKVTSATVAAEDLVIYDFKVYLEAEESEVIVGNAFFVDVMLVGGLNYTLAEAEIVYDQDLLTFTGFSDLSGWVGEVQKSGADTVLVRSVPNMNLYVGAPCFTPVRLVRLKFVANDNFDGKSVDTNLGLASVAVNPQLGVSGTTSVAGNTLTITVNKPWTKDTPEDSLRKIQELYPDYLENGETNPIFDYSNVNNPTTNTTTIFEEVWVEVPCDTDEDGKRDLVRIEICRPAQTGVIIDALTGETAISVPVVMEHSPYRNPSTHRQIPLYNVWKDQTVNPSTAHYTYDDIKTKKARSDNWYWGAGAMYWDETEQVWKVDAGGNPSWYVTPREGALATSKWFIPASQEANDVVFQGNWPAIAPSLSTGRTAPGATYQYFYTRGYAIVTSSSLGNNFNEAVANAMLENTGYNSTANVEEVLPAMAIINWLSGKGDVKAFTDRSATTEVIATWCNGTVAMTGQSYLGTMSMGAATSGVEGLKAILPIAGESVKYNYYRAGGAVSAPGGWQGEECDYLGVRCFYAEDQAAEFALKYPIYQAYLEQMRRDLERDTGDYNTFYDDRNFLTTIDSVRDDCGVMIMHGTNDWNVKTIHADSLYQALKVAGKTVKEIWHLGAHTTVWDKVDSYYMDYYHLWLDHFLYGLDNDAVETIPEVNIPSNNSLNWESYDSWPIAGATDQKWYLNSPSADKAGTFTDTAPAAGVAGSFKDDRVANAGATTEYTTPPTTTDYARSGVISNQITPWENRLFNPAIIDTLSTERLVFVKELTEPLRINGTVKVGLELSSDTPWGNISVALVEVGPNYRAFGTANTTPTTVLNSGHGTSNITLNNYTINGTLSQYKIVTRGFADLQNPNPNQAETYLNAKKEQGFIPDFYFQTQTITPGTNYTYYFTMQPMDYTFKAGAKLAIYVYTTDYAHTQVPKTVVPELTLSTGAKTFVELPIVPTYSIFYDANGGASLYDDLGGYSDAYPIAGQSSKAWEGGYRVVGGVGNTTVAKLIARDPWTFDGWNTEADGSGAAYQPNDRIADNEMSDLTLFAQWYGDVDLDTDGGVLPTGVTSPIRLTPNSKVSDLPDPFKEGYIFTGWALEDEPVTDADIADGSVVGNTLIATYQQEEGITVNFPGVEGVTVQYWTGFWTTVPGTYDDTCTFEVPEGATITSVLAMKGGMWYQQNGLSWTSDSTVVFDVPVNSITVTGIGGACDLGLAQEDWVYRSAPAVVDQVIVYPVFDNAKKYILHLNLPGAPTILIPDIAAGATVDISDYF